MFDPGSADRRARGVFQPVGQIDDGSSSLARQTPVPQREGLIRGEEGHVGVVELVAADALHQSDLVAHRFQLAEGLVVIQQMNVAYLEAAFLHNVGQFLALKGGAADDGDSQFIRTHCSSDASLPGRLGGVPLRRNK